MIKIIEYDHARMFLSEFLDSQKTRTVDVYYFTQNVAETSGVLNRFVFKRIPSIFHRCFVSHPIVFAPNIVMVSNGRTFKIHIDENSISQPNKPLRIDVPIDFRVFGESIIYDVLTAELSSILIEPIGDEYWYEVAPCIGRSRTEQDPTIRLRDLKE